MHKRKLTELLLIVTMVMFCASLKAQKPERIEPPSWWIGFQEPKVQLLVYGKDISTLKPSITYPGVSLERVILVENPNYLFLDLSISPEAKPGKVEIAFKKGTKTISKGSIDLKEREKGSAQREGFNQSDAIYLIMPDRFANAITGNDVVAGMREGLNRQDPYGRHGGDLEGIRQHLDYVQSLGFTSIWLNPVLENDQPESSYHGYAITDFYQVDPRFGRNEDYKKFVDDCRSRGIKVIMDMVFNHCGSMHWWMNDLPEKDWINVFPEYTPSNYRLSTVADPYAAKADIELTTRGWFATAMPDLNLQNELMKNYMIQNSIWWIEYSGLQGIRMDTYPYPDKHGMADWILRLKKEYPDFSVVGETWITQASKLVYWQKDFPNKDGYNSHLEYLMDFPMADALTRAFNEGEGWDTGLQRLYDVLADDHLYRYPLNMVVFAENHDMGRMAHFYGGDLRKMKMAAAFVATVRGIPQWYYGSELLMEGDGAKSHGAIRQDFPGGWPGDQINAFTKEGRTDSQNEMVNYLSALFQYRKASKVLHEGNTLHFVPLNEVYVYFRYLGDEAVMVMMNNNDSHDRMVDMSRFEEILKNYGSGTEVVTGQKYNLDTITVPAKSALIIELHK